MENDKNKDLKLNNENNKSSIRYDSQYNDPQSWAEEAKEDLETWIEEQGVYLRQ